ncbi:pseudouridine synthase [Desulfovibrio sp. OttesenSCG-928-G15]|nr:pseudouridine synthase [Desulfovibrio sp. OttesenSCG-928-G15]
MPRWKSVLIAFDQFVNALCAGWPDETISSRAWRWHRNGTRTWPHKLIDTLFFWDPDHCRQSFLSERLGRQQPPETRK